jgi:uncharacterized protein YndB with AHSA1/START domain
LKEIPMATVSDMARDVTLTRTLDAPRELVWAVWTEPEHMAKWWGPKHFTNPVCELDVRPGGKILIHMRAPDGTVYPMSGVFREIARPERLAFTAFAEGLDGTKYLESHTVVTFEAQGARTKVTVKATAKGLHPLAPQMLAGMEAGWAQSLERLEELTAAIGE